MNYLRVTDNHEVQIKLSLLLVFFDIFFYLSKM